MTEQQRIIVANTSRFGERADLEFKIRRIKRLLKSAAWKAAKIAPLRARLAKQGKVLSDG